MELIDILTSLEDNDFVEIMEVNTTDELHCFVKDSIKYLEKFKKVEAYPNSKAYPYAIYKSAWCHYNLKETEQGIEKLQVVLKNNPANKIPAKTA